jgi:hypothetical protein
MPQETRVLGARERPSPVMGNLWPDATVLSTRRARTAYRFMIGVFSSDAFAFTVRHPSEPRQKTVSDASVPDGHSHAIVRPCSS